MTEGLIRLPPDDVGKAIRTQEVDLGDGPVQQEVHVLGSPDGATLLDPADLATQATLADLLATLEAVIASGRVQIAGPWDRDVLVATGTVTPGTPLQVDPSDPAKALRVWWIGADPNPDAGQIGRVTATLDGKGEIYRQCSIGHVQRHDGSADGSLVIATTDGSVETTVFYEEFTP